jgi:hypothetical protein
VISEEAIRNKIDALRKELDQFIAQANQQIAAYRAAIQVLEELVSPKGESEQGDEQ